MTHNRFTISSLADKDLLKPQIPQTSLRPDYGRLINVDRKTTGQAVALKTIMIQDLISGIDQLILCLLDSQAIIYPFIDLQKKPPPSIPKTIVPLVEGVSTDMTDMQCPPSSLVVRHLAAMAIRFLT